MTFASRAFYCILFVLAGVVASPAVAAQPASGDGSWQFEFTPYLWAAGIKGEVGNGVVGGQPPRVDATFDNLLSKLDFAFMGSLEARKGRWGVFGDLIYLDFSEDAAIKLAPNLPTPGFRFDAELSGTVLALGATYRVSSGHTAVDVLGGLRYYSLDPSVNVTFGPVVRLVEPKKDWTDPIVGLRVRHPLSGRWALTGYADVGGFGIGSDLSYQLYGGVEYAFSKTFTGKLGYRQLRTDYDSDGTKLDLTFGGAMLGLGIRW